MHIYSCICINTIELYAQFSSLYQSLVIAASLADRNPYSFFCQELCVRRETYCLKAVITARTFPFFITFTESFLSSFLKLSYYYNLTSRSYGPTDHQPSHNPTSPSYSIHNFNSSGFHPNEYFPIHTPFPGRFPYELIVYNILKHIYKLHSRLVSVSKNISNLIQIKFNIFVKY